VEPQDPTAPRDCRDKPETQERQELVDQRVTKDQQEMLVDQELREPVDFQELPAKREDRERPEQLDAQDTQDVTERQVHRESMEKTENKDHKDNGVCLV